MDGACLYCFEAEALLRAAVACRHANRIVNPAARSKGHCKRQQPTPVNRALLHATVPDDAHPAPHRHVEVAQNRKLLKRRYHVLGMKDLYLGYAGNFWKWHETSGLQK